MQQSHHHVLLARSNEAFSGVNLGQEPLPGDRYHQAVETLGVIILGERGTSITLTRESMRRAYRALGDLLGRTAV